MKTKNQWYVCDRCLGSFRSNLIFKMRINGHAKYICTGCAKPASIEDPEVGRKIKTVLHRKKQLREKRQQAKAVRRS